MSHATYIIGDTRDVVATLPDNSVDLLLTSPPFLALRSYLPADHPDKHREIGSEAGPAEFINTLLALTAEWGRVIGPYGSAAIELGDTYSGSGGAGGDYNEDGLREGQQAFSGSAAKRAALDVVDGGRPSRSGRDKDAWPMAKSLSLIPELYRIALAYGINPLTGQPSPAGRWRVRNVIRWVRPNPPVGALGDKFRPATSEMVIICRSKDRWFDLDAVRGEPVEPTMTKVGAASAGRGVSGGDSGNPNKERPTANPAGAPPLDWWKISPGGYSGAHFAVYPPELCIKPIEAMCPREVCRQCGEPRRRIVDADRTLGTRPDAHAEARNDQSGNAGGYATQRSKFDGGGSTTYTTVGWSDCGHGDYRPGVVFDPFAGSGTTLAVATGHGRDAIGIDIDERNADLARERIGMFLTVEDRRKEPELVGDAPITASAQHEGQEANPK